VNFGEIEKIRKKIYEVSMTLQWNITLSYLSMLLIYAFLRLQRMKQSEKV